MKSLPKVLYVTGFALLVSSGGVLVATIVLAFTANEDQVGVFTLAYMATGAVGFLLILAGAIIERVRNKEDGRYKDVQP